MIVSLRTLALFLSIYTIQQMSIVLLIYQHAKSNILFQLIESIG